MLNRDDPSHLSRLPQNHLGGFMISLLLVIIYIAFVSLGLPDSLLGAAWPIMQRQLDVPNFYAGIISMSITDSTIISCLLSDRITKRLGAGLVTAVSTLMTAVALFGFSLASSLPLLFFWSIPYGLGAGAIDAALNNYVALHYSSRHMSWLHCFWGLGASISPYIMAYYLTNSQNWNMGYRSVALIQILLTVVLFLTLPLWKRVAKKAGTDKSVDSTPPVSLRHALNIRGVKLILVTFFSYCAMEATAGLWASSFLVQSRGVDAKTAAQFASLFFLGITIGRFLTGFIADRVGNKRLVRYGNITVILGILLLSLPVKTNILCLSGLVIIGLGGAPIFPAIIHSTPQNFGKENSQAIIGIQMASAYTGFTFIPPLFGLISDYTSIGVFPLFLLLFGLLCLLMFEWAQKTISHSEKK